jgi:hypothetical protein
MKKSFILFLLSVLAISPTGFILAQTSLPTKKITIFKNATAMMVKEGNATMKDGNVLLPIPEHTLFFRCLLHWRFERQCCQKHGLEE